MQEHGTKLIGFTKKRSCIRCKNETHLQIRQDYVKSRGFGFIPMGTRHFKVRLICPVCKNEDLLTRASIFSTGDYYAELEQNLMSGKEYTKLWYESLNETDKQEYLKRLNSLKAHSFVKYISGFLSE